MLEPRLRCTPPCTPPGPPQVREFVLQKVYMLKRPKTNVQIIQQSALLKYKYFVRFLRQHGPDVYAEVRGGLPRGHEAM